MTYGSELDEPADYKPSPQHPPMPEDFWPSGGTVSATIVTTELGFRISQTELQAIAEQIPGLHDRIHALRHAVWVAANWTNDHLRVADLRNA